MKRLLLLFTLLSLCSCQTVYYKAMETIGKEKRHLLVDSVEDLKEEQEETGEEFKDVLTRIKTLYDFDGGDLEDVYEDLNADYQSCLEQHNSLTSRISEVETIAADLFSEWEEEIAEITSSRLRSSSQSSLNAAKSRYTKLAAAMHRSESRIPPVLDKLKDNTLYLKHNLNARAIGALKGEMLSIGNDVDSLIVDIQKSISEADKFISTME